VNHLSIVCYSERTTHRGISSKSRVKLKARETVTRSSHFHLTIDARQSSKFDEKRADSHINEYYVHVHVAMCELLRCYRLRNRCSIIIRMLLRYRRVYLRRKSSFILKLVQGRKNLAPINLSSPLGNLISKPRSIHRVRKRHGIPPAIFRHFPAAVNYRLSDA